MWRKFSFAVAAHPAWVARNPRIRSCAGSLALGRITASRRAKTGIAPTGTPMTLVLPYSAYVPEGEIPARVAAK